jgi:hypothetical protein
MGGGVIRERIDQRKYHNAFSFYAEQLELFQEKGSMSFEIIRVKDGQPISIELTVGDVGKVTVEGKVDFVTAAFDALCQLPTFSQFVRDAAGNPSAEEFIDEWAEQMEKAGFPNNLITEFKSDHAAVSPDMH